MRGASGALVIGILAGASAAIVSPCQRLGEGITRTPRVTGSLSATLRNLPRGHERRCRQDEQLNYFIDTMPIYQLRCAISSGLPTLGLVLAVLKYPNEARPVPSIRFLRSI